MSPTVINKAQTLEELRQVCRAEPLESDMLRSFFIETAQACDAHRALPRQSFPGAPADSSDLFARLGEYAREQRAGNKPKPMSDAINQILLRSCVLVEYNGTHWLGVHPLVDEALGK